MPKEATQGKGKLSRRDFLTLLGIGAGGLALKQVSTVFAAPQPDAPPRLGVNAPANKNLLGNETSYQTFFADITSAAEKVGGIWNHKEASSIARPAMAPYLPATQDEVTAHAKLIESQNGNNGTGWGQAVFPRVIQLPSDHPLDHIKDTAVAVKDLGEKRGWGDITAWESSWVYSMIMMGGLKDIQANNQVKVMANGQMVDIDPVRLDNDAIAINVVDRGNPKMAVYTVPQNGEIHARLPQDTTESSVTMAFALNKHHADIKTDASGDDLAAIIVRGVATAPVTVMLCKPIDANGNYQTLVTESRLEALTGNITIHLPRSQSIGEYSPFIVVEMPVVANNPKGETEVIFVPGSDVLQDLSLIHI